MKSAIDGAVTSISSFSKGFGRCSEHFNAGGLLIDGVGADTYSFGGFDNYVEAKITPVINQLSGASSALAAAIKQLEAEIKRLEEEERRKAAEAIKAGQVKYVDAFTKTSPYGKNIDPGFEKKSESKYTDPGFSKKTPDRARDLAR